jgi:uncharacterized membrane protein YbhN (UPF0104 family)
MRKAIFKLIISAGISFLVLYLLYLAVTRSGGELSVSTIINCIRNAVWPLVAVYALCHIAQTFIRAVRARMLLKAGAAEDEVDNIPGFGHVSLVMFVRGACVDMVPMRVGELSYVAMLNMGYNVSVANCLSSLSIGLLFDFAALLIVFSVAITASAKGLSLLGTGLILLIVCVVGWLGLFKILPFTAQLLEKKSPVRLCRWKWYRWCVKTLSEMAESVGFVSRSGIVKQVLLLSAAIRFLKYFGLYFLFVAITLKTSPLLANAGVSPVLTALISAEGAASLPVPAFMSFGPYEAGGLVALTALGFSMAESMAAMFSTHLLSQFLDYSLGGLTFLLFLWLPHSRNPDETLTVRRRRAVRTSMGIVAGLAVLSVLSFGLFRYFSKSAATETEDQIGVSLPGGKKLSMALNETGIKGSIAWSSNREGRHRIFVMDVPSGKVRRVTKSDFTDTYPRFSPDGRRIAFSRSHMPYVSQRDQLKWDTWVVDLQTGRETLVATNAFTAVWDANGESLIYVRDGVKLVKQKAEPDAEEFILYSSGSGTIPAGNQFQTPNIGMGGRGIAFTLRGSANGVYRIVDGEAPVRMSDGCEIAWQGITSPALLWVGHPGRQKNTIFQQNTDSKKPKTLLDVEGDYSHEYFPKVSDDGEWLVFGASTGGHEHDQADYEIFLWKIGTPQSEIVRITWHTGNDCWPDIYLEKSR